MKKVILRISLLFSVRDHSGNVALFLRAEVYLLNEEAALFPIKPVCTCRGSLLEIPPCRLTTPPDILRVPPATPGMVSTRLPETSLVQKMDGLSPVRRKKNRQSIDCLATLKGIKTVFTARSGWAEHGKPFGDN